MKKLVSTASLVSVVGLILVACGGNETKPPAASSATPVSSDTPPPSTASASSSSSSSTPEPPATASAGGAADAGGGGSAPTPKPVVIGETKDECTPVGVDFEKRARPKLKDCYAAGKKTTKNPNLEGTVKIKITVDVKGKIKATKVIEKTLPDSVADCMLKVVKETAFPEVDKCWDSTLTIPITFPTPK